MKFTKALLFILAIAVITSVFPAITLSVNAAENPYDYSGEPTRAIYFTLPTMKGNDVKWVQAALNKFGNYGLAIDGSFGPACKEATKKFQASMGLEQDGSFGPATRAAMVKWLNQNSGNSSSIGGATGSVAANTTVTSHKSENPYNYSQAPSRAIYYTLPTMKGSDVKWVQAALNAYGNYGLATDGSFGPACKLATQKFQSSMGMSQDGSFGPATRSAMINWLSQNGYGYSSGNNSYSQSDKYNLCWPVSKSAANAKYVTSSLGYRNAPVAGATVNHKGIDIGVYNGTNVYATYGGVVTGVGNTNARGNYVVIYHGDIGLTSIYQHLSNYAVSYGQSVSKGQFIGESGSTGAVSGPHLHFELVKTDSQSQSNVDCAWRSGAQLIDGHYDNELINYYYKD